MFRSIGTNFEGWQEEISGLLITLITAIFTGNSPLTEIQLIWVNVLMCLQGGLMMLMELSREEEVVKQSCDRNQPIITKKILKDIVFQVLYQAFVCMILEFVGRISRSEKEVRKTMIFNTFLLCKLFNLLNNVKFFKKQVFFGACSCLKGIINFLKLVISL